jgi:hypothetical protein
MTTGQAAEASLRGTLKVWTPKLSTSRTKLGRQSCKGIAGATSRDRRTLWQNPDFDANRPRRKIAARLGH